MRLVSYTLFCICRKHVLRDRHRSRSARHVLYRFLSLRFASINSHVDCICNSYNRSRPPPAESIWLNNYMRFTQIIATSRILPPIRNNSYTQSATFSTYNNSFENVSFWIGGFLYYWENNLLLISSVRIRNLLQCN